MRTILRSSSERWEKVSSREELISELKEYRFKLSSYVYEYLNSLIDCEISIFNNYCKNDEVFRNERLSDLDIYRKVGIYNIYNQALNLFSKEKNNYNITISGNESGFEGLEIKGKIDYKNFSIFKYNYGMACDTLYSLPISEKCKANRIGNVTLYRSNAINEISELNKDGFNRIIHLLKELRSEKNPYKNGDYVYDVNKSNMWEFNHRRKIMYYNTLLSISSNPNRNYDVLLEQSKIQDYFSELFRKNYGLEEDNSFDNAIVKNNSIVLTKKYPGASVSNVIRYV